jgi:hypothetical protein
MTWLTDRAGCSVGGWALAVAGVVAEDGVGVHGGLRGAGRLRADQAAMAVVVGHGDR